MVSTSPDCYLEKLRKDCPPPKVIDAQYQPGITLVHEGKVAWKGYVPSAVDCPTET